MGRNDDGDEKSEPTLELPSLFGRKKRAQTLPAEPPEQAEATAPDPEPRESSPSPDPPAEPSEPSGPALPGQLAAIVTGVVVGLLGTLLTFAAMAGCEAVRGTSSCGGPGFLLLVAILVLMVLAGVVLLKVWQVSDPGSTSFLAVGVIAVIVLLLLLDVIYSGWMFLAVPALGAVGFALSHWVTTRFADEGQEASGPYDVR